MKLAHGPDSNSVNAPVHKHALESPILHVSACRKCGRIGKCPGHSAEREFVRKRRRPATRQSLEGKREAYTIRRQKSSVRATIAPHHETKIPRATSPTPDNGAAWYQFTDDRHYL